MAEPLTKWDLLSNLPKQASGSDGDTPSGDAPADQASPTDAPPGETPTDDAATDAGSSADVSAEGAASDAAPEHSPDETAADGHSETFIEAVESLEGAPPEDHHAEGFFEDTYTYTGFALLLLIVFIARPAWRAITGMLDGRADRIRNELDEAQRLREEAQAALANFQRKQRDALAEAEGIVHHAREESERIRQRSLDALEHSLKRREQQALDRIAQAEASAMSEVRSLAVDVAVAAARDLVVQQSDASSDAERINAAIEDLPAKLH